MILAIARHSSSRMLLVNTWTEQGAPSRTSGWSERIMDQLRIFYVASKRSHTIWRNLTWCFYERRRVLLTRHPSKGDDARRVLRRDVSIGKLSSGPGVTHVQDVRQCGVRRQAKPVMLNSSALRRRTKHNVERIALPYLPPVLNNCSPCMSQSCE